MLTADDVAPKVLWAGRQPGRTPKAPSQRGCGGATSPGLRKVMGRWLVPITALADWMNGLAEPAEVSAPPVGPVRRVSASSRSTYRRAAAGRLPNKVREAQRRARANHFMGEVLACWKPRA